MAKGTIRILKKLPGEPWRWEVIDNTLEALQKAVDGPIECVNIGSDVLICNEEGKLRGMDKNILFRLELFVGPVLCAGTDGEEFTDCPINMQAWLAKNSIELQEA